MVFSDADNVIPLVVDCIGSAWSSGCLRAFSPVGKDLKETLREVIEIVVMLYFLALSSFFAVLALRVGKIEFSR